MGSYLDWVKNVVELCEPEVVHYCDGSREEYQSLCDLLVRQGTFIPLKRPHSYLARSSPHDVARSEDATFICSEKERDAGPSNNWRNPQEMHGHLRSLFKGCMKGRTLYVIPFLMGPLGSPLARYGIQITDSPYVVCHMTLMTRVAKEHFETIQTHAHFVKCIHSLGVPLERGQKPGTWDCNPKKKCIAHFPETHEVWSYGSGYGGNALLAKKCFALRLASVMAKKEGWLAEHMLILGITNPQGVKKYFAAAFPSSCGKTNLATLTSNLPGWSVECVGDDIAWMYFDHDGRLRAINPEAGSFGVAPGVNAKKNGSLLKMLQSDTLFTNVGLTPDHDVWWEGLTDAPPSGVIAWDGTETTRPVSHPNARFTARMCQCPVVDPHWEDPSGVEISAILFGGRRSDTMPLVLQSFNWRHGVYLGATLASETTAAAEGARGELRRDPFAMRPFCGYNMADYFKHWLSIPEHYPHAELPLIFHVNWFRKGSDGRYLWPGYNENIRVLKWIFERTEQSDDNILESACGMLPRALDLKGLNLSVKQIDALFSLSKTEWQIELQAVEEFLKTFGDDLPQELLNQFRRMQYRLRMQD